MVVAPEDADEDEAAAMAMAMAEVEVETETETETAAMAEAEHVSLSLLPLDCLSLILGLTSASDACRLASVSRSFAFASRSNLTWLRLLLYPLPLPLPLPPPSLLDLRLAFQFLSQGVFLNRGLHRLSLLKRSRGVCLFVSASAMAIAWGADSRFWQWKPSRSSWFPKVAHLKAVCWLSVDGCCECTLPPGKYSICWRLKVANPQGGQEHFLAWKKPLQFSFTYLGINSEKELDILDLPNNGFEKWFEFEVAEIVLHGRENSVVNLQFHFRLQEIDCTFWKGGLSVDCVTVKPSGCSDMIYCNQPEKPAGVFRGRTGVF